MRKAIPAAAFRRAFIPAATFLLVATALFSQTLKVASFSMERLGDGAGKDYQALAGIMRKFDVVGCVDVRSPETFAGVVKRMGVEWKGFVSERPTGSAQRREYYGYIWKAPKVRMAQPLGYFNDAGNTYTTKPYAAEFETSDFDLTVILSHITAGPYAKAQISRWGDVYNYYVGLVSGGNVILAGDFGRAGRDDFDNLLSIDGLDDALDFSALTALGPHGPVSASDHIFVNLFTRNRVVRAGAYDYVPDFAGGDYGKARRTVSDHLPVSIELKMGAY